MMAKLKKFAQNASKGNKNNQQLKVDYGSARKDARSAKF
jgi:hypothetical protein